MLLLLPLPEACLPKFSVLALVDFLAVGVLEVTPPPLLLDIASSLFLLAISPLNSIALLAAALILLT